ncbi:hypothetical protein J7F03_30625 [Streptomyces sp. ISL-43]|nr:hypothetical protein [Streptomyces sp. ISL-43]
MTIESKNGTPVVLSTKQSMILIAKDITQFPTRGDISTLESPVDFIDPEKPHTVVARLVTFNAKTGGI